MPCTDLARKQFHCVKMNLVGPIQKIYPSKSVCHAKDDPCDIPNHSLHNKRQQDHIECTLLHVILVLDEDNGGISTRAVYKYMFTINTYLLC